MAPPSERNANTYPTAAAWLDCLEAETSRGARLTGLSLPLPSCAMRHYVVDEASYEIASLHIGAASGIFLTMLDMLDFLLFCVISVS